ncbi:MAG: hypothetical protein AAGE84_27125 [Cyanobacteria bacterium P01_G01_bin.39]
MCWASIEEIGDSNSFGRELEFLEKFVGNDTLKSEHDNYAYYDVDGNEFLSDSYNNNHCDRDLLVANN